MPGFRSPVCVRCGNPNPRPLLDREWDELLDYRNFGRGERSGKPFGIKGLEAAIAAENDRRRTVAAKIRDIMTEISEVNA
jgi:hypothetical protein